MAIAVLSTHISAADLFTGNKATNVSVPSSAIRSRIAAGWDLGALNSPTTTLNLFPDYALTVTWVAVDTSLVSPVITHRAIGPNCQGCNIAILHSGNELRGYVSANGRLFSISTIISPASAKSTNEYLITEVPQKTFDTLTQSDLIQTATGGATLAPLAPIGSQQIDILAVVSPQVLALDPNGLLREQSMAYLNNAMSLQNSPINFRYAGTQLIGNLETAVQDCLQYWLGPMANPNDGIWDEILPYRDAIGADLVAAFSTSVGTGPCGVPGVSNGMPVWVDSNGVVRYTYAGGLSVNLLSAATSTLSIFAHEVGHGMGAGHYSGDPNAGGYAIFSRGHAMFNFPAPLPSSARTIMTYGNYCNAQDCSETGNFSSPLVFFNGRATGVPNVSDNARTIAETAGWVAANRPVGGTAGQIDIDLSPLNPNGWTTYPFGPPTNGPIRQKYQLLWINNGSGATATNITLTVDVEIEPALRVPFFARVIVNRGSNFPCSNSMISATVERWVCTGINIAYGSSATANIIVEHTGPNALPIKIDANVQPGVGDFRPGNNSISETHLVPY